MRYAPIASLEKLTFWSLLALIVWLPIPLGSHRIWAWSIMELWVGFQSILLVLSYRGNLPYSAIKHYQYLLTPLCLFQLWVLIQSLPIPWSILEVLSPHSYELYRSVNAPQGYLSLDSRITWAAFVKGLCYTVIIFNAAIVVNSSHRLKLVALAIIISGTVQAFYAALLVLLNTTQSPLWGFPEQAIATGSFVYKNHLANFLMLTLCIGLGLIITDLRVTPSGNWTIRLRRILEGILSPKMLIRLCLIIMVIALVMTRSRMGNSAFFAATALSGVIALLFYKHRPRALTFLLASVIAIDTIVVGSLFGLKKVTQRLIETSMANESRDQVLIWSLDIVRDFPLTGSGMSTFYSIFPMYSQAILDFYDHAHNDYLQFAVESGIPATLLLAFVVLVAFWRCIHTIHTRNSRTMKGLSVGCMMAVIGMLIHISVDFPLQPAANAATFSIILFMAHACSVLPATGKLCIAPQSAQLTHESQQEIS